MDDLTLMVAEFGRGLVPFFTIGIPAALLGSTLILISPIVIFVSEKRDRKWGVILLAGGIALILLCIISPRLDWVFRSSRFKAAVFEIAF